MTKSRHITPHEWIGDYFSPAVTVMACPEVEALCAKNNLTLTETLQPFAKLMTDVTLKDPEGVNHAVPSLHVIFQVSRNLSGVRSPGLLKDFRIPFQDFKKDPSRLINQKLMSDLVDNLTEEPQVSKTFENRINFTSKVGFANLFVQSFHGKIS